MILLLILICRLNGESKNTKEALEYELSATKAKLLKSELKISSLETAIETKTRENSELMTICDELIHKMDKRCSWTIIFEIIKYEEKLKLKF